MTNSKRATYTLISTLVIAAGSCWAGFAAAKPHPQPNMEAALKHLTEAKSFLEKASHDKGGHRAKALELTLKAVTEVQAGISFSNEHAN